MSEQKEATTCPVCNSPVCLVASEEGTSYYQSLVEVSILDEMKGLQKWADDLNKVNHKLIDEKVEWLDTSPSIVVADDRRREAQRERDEARAERDLWKDRCHGETKRVFDAVAQHERLAVAASEALALLEGKQEFDADLTIYGPGGMNVVRIKRVCEMLRKALGREERE